MVNEFGFLNLKSNDKLSQMKDNDIFEFLKELKKYKLGLRESLGLEKSDTFGVEIEFEDKKLYNGEIADLLDSFGLRKTQYYDDDLRYYSEKKVGDVIYIIEKSKKVTKTISWSVKDDTSLVNGAEIVSPILVDDISYWNDLVKVCDFIKTFADIGENCAGHIHVGTQIIGSDYDNWLNFFKLWSLYEDVIYRFGYNEYLTKNPGIKHCFPISDKLKDIYSEYYYKGPNSMESMMDKLILSREQAVNFQNVYYLENLYNEFVFSNTIEFRSPNGTLDPVIWQNNVNFFIKLLKCLKGKCFDIERLKLESVNPNTYNEIKLRKALELSDMVFDNNLDKVYFLKQYFKDFDVSNKPMVKTKKFTI